MTQFFIGEHPVGEGHPAFVISEIGVNHNGNIYLARELIKASYEAGTDAVKFQMFLPKELCSPLYRSEEIKMLEKYTLTFEQMKALSQYAHELGLEFLITPFDALSLENVIKLGCPAIKIGSGELTHTPFLQNAATFKVPIILSTGAGNIEDVQRAVDAMREASPSTAIALLHCVSSYPAPDESMNILAISTLKDTFSNCVIGLSDHSLGSTAAILSIGLKASIIEKHMTLDKNMEGPDHKASASVEEFAALVREVRRAETMLGDGIKKNQKSEGTIGRSMVAAADLPAGKEISEKDIAYKRPGNGLRPYLKDKIIGKRLKVALKENEQIQWEYFYKE